MIFEEWQLEQQYCSGVNVSTVYAKLKESRNDMPFAIGSVIYTDPKTVDIGGTEAEYGYGYADISDRNSLIDIKTGNYAAGLNVIGEFQPRNWRWFTTLCRHIPILTPKRSRSP